MALSLYVLPLLYGLLGAFAFVLRKLSDPVGKLTYAHDTRVSYTLRLHIGALSGLAVGWFINGNTPSSGLTALSPLALAFAAGFGSDLLFTALDKVISAFSPLMSSQNAAVHTEATFGGMTVTNDAQRDTRVAGGSVPVPHQADQGLKPDIEPDKRAEPALPAAGTSRSKAA
jgi:hypothetical protein